LNSLHDVITYTQSQKAQQQQQQQAELIEMHGHSDLEKLKYNIAMTQIGTTVTTSASAKHRSFLRYREPQITS